MGLDTLAGARYSTDEDLERVAARARDELATGVLRQRDAVVSIRSLALATRPTGTGSEPDWWVTEVAA
jgi:hypothetical protein